MGYRIAKNKTRSPFRVIAENGYVSYNPDKADVLPLPIPVDLDLALQDPQSHIYSLMALADYYATAQGIVATVVDVMTEFSASKFRNQSPVKKYQKFFDEIKDDLGLNQLVQEMFRDYYIKANIYPYVYWNDNRPIYIDLMNPNQIEVGGRILTNKTQLYLKPPDRFTGLLDQETDPATRSIIESLPKEVREGLRDGLEKIPLNPENTYHVARKKRRYERYGVPFLARVFKDLMTYQLFRKMESETAENVINALTLFTVGSDQHPAKQKQIDAVWNLIKDREKSYTLVWNHTLKVDIICPDPELFNPVKYKQIRDDILDGLGITRVLISGEGASYATAWVSILALIERMEAARDDVTRWVRKLYADIAVKNGIPVDKIPNITFDRMNLRDEKVVKSIMVNLYDRGALSAQTLLEDCQYDFETEMRRRRDEQDKYKEELTPPQLPYTTSGKGRPSSPETKNPDKSTNNPRPSD